MHMLRSFVLGVGFLVLLGAFTACGKVHPATQPAEENVPVAGPARPSAPAPRHARPSDAGTAVALAARPADSPAISARLDAGELNRLHLEVTALEMIDQFKFTRPQLEHLAKLAPTTAHKSAPPKAVKVSDEYQRTLKELHAALLDGNEVRAADLALALDDLRDKESPDFEEVAITDAARRHTGEVLRGLSPRQLVGYLTEFAEEFPEPREKIIEAFEEVRKLPDGEWQELRDEVAGQVGWLVAGMDTAAESRVRKSVAELLERVRKMKDEDFTSRREALEKQAEEIVRAAGPTEVMRHFAERSLAELLSNPRLGAAVAARLKNAE